MKRKIWEIVMLLASFGVFALSVDKNELEKAGGRSHVEFFNYTGPHAKIDSLESIKGIGRSLGEGIKKGGVSAGDKTRYFVFHAHSKAEEGLLQADIMFLGKSAGVDHIKNLRRIISAYLKTAYGYSEEDADTLSVFISVYNAVYRGNASYYKSRYTSEVMSHLSAKYCGLSSSYLEWAGKSEIVIPLSDSPDVSAIDTSLISGKEVTSRLKDKKGIEKRKGMVSIKEKEGELSKRKAQKEKSALNEVAKEVKNKEEAAQKAREEVEGAKEEVNKAKKKALLAERKTQDARKEEEAKKEKALLKEKEEREAEEAAKGGGEKEKAALKEARLEAEEAKKEALSSTAAREEAEKEEKEAKREQKALERELERAEGKQEKSEEELKSAKEKKEAKEKEVKRAQELSEKKISEAEEERKDIAKDQMKLLESEEETGPLFSALRLSDEERFLSCIVKVSTKTGKAVASSKIQNIRRGKMYQKGGSIFAIAGEKSGKSAIKLVEIEGDTLEMKNESQESVSGESDLLEEGNLFYCVIEEGDKYKIAAFTQDLKMASSSEAFVKKATPITIGKEALAVTAEDGSVILLEKSSLKMLKK